MQQKNYCTTCAQEIHGRKDKRFCSDQCRATHYNNQHADITPLIRNVNNILRRNRRILAQLNPKGVTTIHRQQLVDYSFSFEYHTHITQTTSGQFCYFCYDQGYVVLEDDFFTLLIRGKEIQKDQERAYPITKKTQRQL